MGSWCSGNNSSQAIPVSNTERKKKDEICNNNNNKNHDNNDDTKPNAIKTHTLKTNPNSNNNTKSKDGYGSPHSKKISQQRNRPFSKKYNTDPEDEDYEDENDSKDETPETNLEPGASSDSLTNLNNSEIKDATKLALQPTDSERLYSKTTAILKKKESKQYTVVVTPPLGMNANDDYENEGSLVDINYDSNKKMNADFDIITNNTPIKPKPKKPKVDPTLNGIIDWKKVGDFSAVLPKDTKLKLWKGVFKNGENDNTQNEIRRIQKVLKTFVMLHLTRQCKKDGKKKVSDDIKNQLPGAVKEPSKFLSFFLKKQKKFIDDVFASIYDTISAKASQTKDLSTKTKKIKYQKKVHAINNNYAQLKQTELKKNFNKDDYLKDAYMQYLLYAYQIRLDTDKNKSKK